MADLSNTQAMIATWDNGVPASTTPTRGASRCRTNRRTAW